MNILSFREHFLFRLMALCVLVAFIGLYWENPSYAQTEIVVPQAVSLLHLTPHFEPPQIIGLKVDLKYPFSFDFIMDQGQKPLPEDVKREEFNKLIKYFLVSLTMPNKDMWVNLSPYEHQRMIPEVFAQTQMGGDLLAQDYILKQFTASLIYPDSLLGKKFWNAVYQKAQAQWGTTDIPVHTFNKVWILADHADVYQKNDTGLLVASHLKVMLDEDYMALEKHRVILDESSQGKLGQYNEAKHQLAASLMRQIVIPAIEKEVNEGENFAVVRQVYHAEILATWFKKTLKNSLLAEMFVNKIKIAGQKINDTKEIEIIYQQSGLSDCFEFSHCKSLIILC